MVSRVTNSLVLMYAVPIWQDGRVVGVLVGRRDAGALNAMTDRLGFGERGWAVVFSPDGTVFAHPNREYVLEQRNLFNEREQEELAAAGQAVRELGVGQTGIIRYEAEGAAASWRWRLCLPPAGSSGWEHWKRMCSQMFTACVMWLHW